MRKVLFINGCVRGKNSRTLTLAKDYIDKLNSRNEYEIVQINLNSENVGFMSGKSFNEVTGDMNEFDNTYAKQFAQADLIVLAAPYWEFMFPAIVSCYFEAVSVPGITFRYTENGSVGMCNAKKFTYIYTSGDYLCQKDKINEQYLKRLTCLYGISDFSVISAHGLDIEKNNPYEILKNACNSIRIF